MVEWCMAHPWMTFFLIYWALKVLDNIAINILKMLQNKHILNIEKERGADGGSE